MSFERFLTRNMRNRVFTGLRDTCQRANMFQKTCKTLGYMEIIAFKIPLGVAKPYLSHGLAHDGANIN